MRRRVLLTAAAFVVLSASSALAHGPGWGGPRFYFGLYAPPVYFGGPPVYAPPPPVYYAPRPVVVAPPPVYAAPPPVYAAPPPAYYYPRPY